MDAHGSDGGSPCEPTYQTTWCVSVPSEAVLLMNSLDDLFNRFGKVVGPVTDIDE